MSLGQLHLEAATDHSPGNQQPIPWETLEKGIQQMEDIPSKVGGLGKELIAIWDSTHGLMDFN